MQRSRLTDPPEQCSPTVGLGAAPAPGGGPPGAALPPHPGPAGPALQRSITDHVHQIAAIHVAANLIDGHCDLIARVLGLHAADVLHALGDVVRARHERFSSTPAPTG